VSLEASGSAGQTTTELPVAPAADASRSRVQVFPTSEGGLTLAVEVTDASGLPLPANPELLEARRNGVPQGERFRGGPFELMYMDLPPGDLTVWSVAYAGVVLEQTVDLSAPLGAVDPARSVLFSDRPVMRADGHDLATLFMLLVDERGRIIRELPQAEESYEGVSVSPCPWMLQQMGVTGEGWGAGWRQGTIPYFARCVRAEAGTARGRVRFGELEAEIILLPPLPQAAAKETSALALDDFGVLRLYPRDAHNHLLGSNAVIHAVRSEPAGSALFYEGDGSWRVLGPTERVTVELDGFSLSVGAPVVAPAVDEEPVIGCQHGARSGGSAAPLWLLLMCLSLLYRRRGRFSS
jgi:hypothetical protein